jgi:SAM-dependent methyltransferase
MVRALLSSLSIPRSALHSFFETTAEEDRRMANVNNKDHWYDGRFYDLFIAPHQDPVFELLGKLIKERSSVLDVGCGTGRLAFQLRDKCVRFDGVDLSRRNVAIARQHLVVHPSSLTAFHHADIFQFLDGSERRYDYAVMTYVLHEMELGERIPVVRALAQAAHELVIVDYLVPLPRTLTGLLSILVERAAGRDHYRNFRTFVRTRGLSGLVDRAGLTIVEDIRGTPPGAHIVVVREEHRRIP